MESFVHIHIGKTAGTSLRNMLEQAYGGGHCSPPFIQNYMTLEESNYYSGFRIVSGHISRADQLKWFGDRRVLTVLREPIDRGLSFLYYVKSLKPEGAQVAIDAHRMSTLELIETAGAQENLHNTMVRQLGGHMLDKPDCLPELLERAKETLRSAAWVGTYSTLNEDLGRLAAQFGLEIAMRRDNVTPQRATYDTEDPRVLNRLYELNGYDMQLWNWLLTERAQGRLVGAA